MVSSAQRPDVTDPRTRQRFHQEVTQNSDKRVQAIFSISLLSAFNLAMKVLLLSLVLASMTFASPSLKPRVELDGAVQECREGQCLHDQLRDSLQQEVGRREVDDMRQERTRRQAQDRPWIPEDQKCEDGTPHCFHGWHIFNLQPYHVEK